MTIILQWLALHWLVVPGLVVLIAALLAWWSDKETPFSAIPLAILAAGILIGLGIVLGHYL